jgi:hypothetical protein
LKIVLPLLAACVLAAEEPVAASVRTDLRTELVAEGTRWGDARIEIGIDLPYPADGAILRLGAARFAPCLTDAGERVVPLPPPGRRTIDLRHDRRLMRERVARLALWVILPPRPCGALLALEGTVAATVVSGEPVRTTLPATVGTADALPGVDDGAVKVVEAAPGRLVLECGPGAAERLVAVDAEDAEGAPIDVRMSARGAARTGRVEASWEGPQTAARLRLRWWPRLDERLLPVALARIDIPGGLPGTDGAAPPVPTGRKPPKDAPAWWKALAAGERPAIDAALAGGADPAAMVGDAGSAWEFARDARRWDVLHRLAGNPWPPAP